MNYFERVYQTDPDREMQHNRELNHSIELSDLELIERKYQHLLAFTGNPPLIPMVLEMPRTEEAIREGKKNEKKKSKTTKSKDKKVSAKSNKSTVEGVQKKL